MLKHYYFQNKNTGELVTYSQARNEFYKRKRTALESIFDEYEETKILSNEEIEMPNFIKTLKK